MNMRNLLRPGDFVMPVPVGIHLTLQYNVSGNLQKVYVGYGSDRIDHTDDMLSLLTANSVVPPKIHITRGTSWVRGVLYTNYMPCSQGVLPKAIESELIAAFIKNPTSFNFFAGTIESTSTVFRGSTPIRQCLAIAKFRILPGWLVPYNFGDNIIDEWVNAPQYTFSPIVADFIIFHGEDVSIRSASLSQLSVDDIIKYVDYNGYVKAKIHIKASDKVLDTDFSDVVRLNIHKGSLLILDSAQKITMCKNIIKVHDYDKLMSCPYCGKRYEIPSEGQVICPNIHCSSRLMQSIIQFMDTFKLSMPSSDTIAEWLKSNTVTCIPDLLLLNEYRDCKIETTISEFLKSLIPHSLISDDYVIMALEVGCSNQERTFRYYVENPDRISADLHIRHNDLNKLIVWLSDSCNVSDIMTLLDSPQITIGNVRKKFDGAPIFRNKTIFLTGKFIRGTIPEIAAILQSYSATVTTQFSDLVDCVLTGGMQEEIDGKSIRAAKTLNKPVMNEDDFFIEYDIDSDLRYNLVYC